jgi:putative tryptophan/tyrosine transport system substrate-binding protein
MQRREFITLLGGAAVAWPLAARAQQQKVWRIGMLDTASRELNSANLAVFYKELRDFGYVEGQNLIIEYRSADGRNERLPDLVSELLRLNVDLIVVRGTPEVLAIKNATSTIPVVMSAVVDPVGLGVAASLRRPGGNITGMSSIVTELEAKRVELLKELVPGMKRMALLGDFRNSAVAMQWDEVQIAARSLGIEAQRFDVRSTADVNRAFEVAIREHVDAIRVGVDGVTRPNRRLIIDLAAMHKLPTIYAAREFADEGGLIAYAANYAHLYLRAASFVDKIFKGANPADIPVEQPTKFDLIVNLKTAKALGLTVPYTLLARADEVIE